jgi:hypothetical protein
LAPARRERGRVVVRTSVRPLEERGGREPDRGRSLAPSIAPRSLLLEAERIETAE